MLTIQQLSYTHPNKDVVFNNINLVLQSGQKTALVGNNGTGKSTLLKLIAGELQPANGTITTDAIPYSIPQLFGQYNQLTVAEALGIDKRLHALHELLNGNTSEEVYEQLNDDWTIEERCNEAMNYWQLGDVLLTSKLETLSGGQKTKVFLAGMQIHQPELVLLDEPSNHLDANGRKLLYDFILHTRMTVIVVSHDRELLNLLNTIHELGSRGITTYGGNYTFYQQQKLSEKASLAHDIQHTEKALKKAREKERETIERQQKNDARGKKKQEQSGVARIMMNTLRNNAENSTAKAKNMHGEKISSISQELTELRSSLPEIDQMKFGFAASPLHKGKVLFTADAINFCHENGTDLWQENLQLEIRSGERIVIKGGNGSGKTTLIRIILGQLVPKTGTATVAESNSVYIDQDYSLLNNQSSVYEQAQLFNTSALLEHEVKLRLNRFLFPKEDWGKPCSALSGGERMRLLLCCLTIDQQSPDMIVLDEPTNNLDLRNIEILTAAINEYNGTLIIVSHDATFVEHINPGRSIELS